MEYTSSQMVHMLSLPYEVTDIINSFCFEDKIKAKIKKCKKIIYYKFKTNKHGIKSNFGSWSIWLQNSKVNEKQFQGLNCMKCGNYLQIGNGILFQTIKCNC
jgi:hypothetical protein